MSFDDLYKGEFGRLVALLRSMGLTTGDAEEVAQDGFLRLLVHWQKVSGYEDPAGWVRSVAARMAVSRLRRAAVARRMSSLFVSREPITVDSTDQLHIRAALNTLAPIDRVPLVLHYLADMPVSEIASLLHVPEGTVKSRLSRARDRLQVVLEDQPTAEGSVNHAPGHP